MEVTPNSPDSSTLGTVIKQITVPHILYKDSSMRGKAFKHFYLRNYSLLTENSKFTNFTIGGLLAGPYRSPLIQCSCLQDTAQRSLAFETYQPTDIQGTISYVYNFENHNWTLHIQYQFTIIVCEILLNTTQNKRINWFNNIYIS